MGETFRVVPIKPSRYDDEGYVIQWMKAWVPSNTLSSLYGPMFDLVERKALGLRRHAAGATAA